MGKEVKKDVDIDIDDDKLELEDDDIDVNDTEEDVVDDDVTDEEGDDEDEITFTDKQQEFIDELVEKRIARATRRGEAKFEKTLAASAGVDVDREELVSAAALWGFLKLNPALSKEVQKQIDEFTSKNEYVKQDAKKNDVKENELSKREAILDLKAEDSYFAKNSKKILEWAEEEDFEIKDAKTLKRAYLAYKGAKGALDLADEELKKSRKKAQTPTKKSSTKVAMGKRQTSGKNSVDYRKMSDSDILHSMGKSLFTDD